ncbi:MAG: DUF4350 domain-containing protein [Aeoliella sp.]
MVVLLFGLMAGCDEPEVYSDYGHRGGWTQTSLNGTRTFGNMFKRAGHKVRSWRYLSPSLDEADVIVWAPDDFEPPADDVHYWLVHWLANSPEDRPGRVLIYIGRDYDAAPDYWQRMQLNPPAGLKNEYARRLREARNDATTNRPAPLKNRECDDWFTYDPDSAKAQVKGLLGPWARGVDSSQVEIQRHTRLLPGEDATLLLADENGKELVSEMSYEPYYNDYDAEDGRLILIENGSFLLNAALVNHEHRKLAGRLVDHVGPPKKRVVFLESNSGGPAIRETDPSNQPPTGLQLFRVWPIGAVLTQLAALGIVFALMKWPLFGLPRRLQGRSPTDFGSHVAALGRLLRNSKDRRHAFDLLRLYRQSLHRDTVVCDTVPIEIELSARDSLSPPPHDPPSP